MSIIWLREATKITISLRQLQVEIKITICIYDESLIQYSYKFYSFQTLCI